MSRPLHDSPYGAPSVRRATRALLRTSVVTAITLAAPAAYAQAIAPGQLGVPPPEAKALVAGAPAPTDAPKIEKKDDLTAVTLSAGGVMTSGNSRLFAMTANGNFELRRELNGVGASLLANYGEGGPAGTPVRLSAQNLQGRVRYDRFVSERASAFLIATGRHDRFQGLDFRLNLDPGFKYIVAKDEGYALWGELGYDFQYDIRRDASRIQTVNNATLVDASGQPILLPKNQTDHSGRLFAGLRYAFNPAVTFTGGVEFLQSFVDTSRSRVNVDVLFAAKVAGGFSVGFGLSARYDNAPLPGKENLDTTATANLIYGYSDAVAKPKEPTCPCPPPPPAPPPANSTPLGSSAPPPPPPAANAAPPVSSPPAATPPPPAPR